MLSVELVLPQQQDLQLDLQLPPLPFVMKLRSSGSRDSYSSTGAQMLLTDLAYPASDDG
uniref:Uncharacterized protein n=1 Tax=Picea glauca TaxID=3330 RepID=A0A101M253_PICGL|nr:hypothetical protein ABT39_MTgene2892 [Picea glauca]QHR87575.1 hypothetical protein Q903MT_gene1586 [Picea sitchensis]